MAHKSPHIHNVSTDVNPERDKNGFQLVIESRIVSNVENTYPSKENCFCALLLLQVYQLNSYV